MSTTAKSPNLAFLLYSVLQNWVLSPSNAHMVLLLQCLIHIVVVRRLDAYYLGWSPSTFYRVYSIQVVVLMAVRWIVYRFKLWHYYLLDFCYAGTCPSMGCLQTLIDVMLFLRNAHQIINTNQMTTVRRIPSVLLHLVMQDGIIRLDMCAGVLVCSQCIDAGAPLGVAALGASA